MRDPKDMVVKRLYGYSRESKRLILLGVVLSMVATALSVVMPVLLSDIMDEFAETIGHFEGSDTIFASINTLIVLCVAALIISTLKERVVSRGSSVLAETLRMDLFDKIKRIPYSHLLEMRSGDLASCITNDCNQVSELSGSTMVDTIESIILVVGSTAMMAYTDMELTVVCVLPIASAIMITVFFSKSLDKYYYTQRRDLGKVNNRILEYFYGHLTIRASSAEDRAHDEFHELNQTLGKRMRRYLNYGAVVPSMMGFITNIGYVTICGYGLIMIADGRGTFGIMIAFLVYMKLFTQPINDMSSMSLSFKELQGASARIFEILDAEEMIDRGTTEKKDFKGDVEFDDVCFSYGGKYSMSNISFKVKAGQTVAIIGPSGSGKTTAMNLLTGLFSPDSGTIFIDGTPISDLNYNQMQNMFSLVEQDSWVFRGTFRSNIVYNSDPVEEEDLIKVIDSVGLGYVLELPDGLDTMIDNPATLSEGQRQQISVARAVIHKAPILVLDEATSSLDIRTEKAIVDALENAARKRTSFIIAHRLSTIRSADLVLVLNEGRLHESGSMHDLLQKKGMFYDMVSAQSCMSPPSEDGAA